MSVIGNPLLLGGDAGAPSYTIDRSVRLRSSATSYFNRTPASAGNRKTWTWSAWVKRGTIGSGLQSLFVAIDVTATNYLQIMFNSDALYFYANPLVSGGVVLATSQVFRDPSAWYHIVAVLNTTSSTASDRAILYVNGQRITSFSTNNASTITQNADAYLNSAVQHNIGNRQPYGNSLFDGYLTEINFVDGQALTPSSFGEYDAVRNTQWKPKAYTGTYGTNGFYLPFGNNASVEALGYDQANGQSELITNGMFVANVSGWTNAPFGGGTPSITWQSNHTARIANPSNNGTVYYQAITTVVGQTYYAQALVAAASIGGASRTIALQKADNAAFSVNNITVASIAQSAAPSVMRGTFVATATTTYIFINVDILGTGTTGADISQVSVSLNGYKNSWNPFGISLTAGVTYDSMTDVPTLTSANNANFCTLNQLRKGTGATLSEANLTWSMTLNNAAAGTIGVSSGKWYWEVTAGTRTYVGIVNESASIQNQLAGINGGYCYAFSGTLYYNGGTSAAYGATYTSGDIIGVALDMDSGTLTFYKNNASQGVAFTSLSGIYFPATGSDSATTATGSINFGQRPFSYTPPTGFKSLNTYNLPEPAVASSDDYHKVYTYTGNGGGLQVGEIQKPASLFNLDRSLRLRSSNSAYLSRTSGTPTNANIWTFSGWIKRGTFGTRNTLLCGGTTNVNYICFNDSSTNDYFGLTYANTPSQLVNVMSSQSFKDPAIWNHFMVVYDSTSATTTITGTSTDRVRLYVNGIQVTSFSATTPPAQNTAVTINTAATILNLCRRNLATADSYFDGYLADVYFIDGQALTPDSFGTYDGNNYWTPIAYSGSYGTNGFHLEFEDYSGATATTIGKDTSGNSNNWTPSGINVTTPANTNVAWDSMTDVPTLTDENTSNFCTLTPLTTTISGTTWSNGNLTISFTATSTKYQYPCTNTLTNGKWYFEGNLASFSVGNAGNNFMMIGFKTPSSTSASPTMIEFGWGSNGTAMSLRARYIVAGTVVTNTQFNTTTPVSTDVFAVAYDASAGTMDCYKNGTLMGTLSNISLGEVVPVVCRDGTTNGATWNLNFGQRPFRNTPPSGFKAINSANIAEVTGDVETPDFVWIKSRSAATGHALFSKVTGEGKYLSSNATTAETTDVNSLIQFNKNGFLLGNSAIVNTLSNTYVASAWKAGNTTATNTDGSISSQVRANPSAGFSTVTYTGTGANATVGHGLGIAPKMVIVKSRSITSQWAVYHQSLGNTNTIYLNLTNAVASQPTFWNSTSPTSSVFSLGTDATVNGNGNNLVAYCFSEIAGYSKFGSYTGNGSTDGPFVYTGFRPRWVMIKRTDTTADWIIWDTERSTINAATANLYPDLSNVEYSDPSVALDFLSNGFKLRNTNIDRNASGGTYIFAAFAEHPFKYSLGR